MDTLLGASGGLAILAAIFILLVFLCWCGEKLTLLATYIVGAIKRKVKIL